MVLGTQQPYPTKGRLLVFNGTYEGRPALLGQIYSSHPFANSFVIPFEVGRLGHGRFGTALTAKLPRTFTDRLPRCDLPARPREFRFLHSENRRDRDA